MLSVLLKFTKPISRLLAINPRRLVHIFKGWPIFFRDLVRYIKITPDNGRFYVRYLDLYPVYHDRFESAGEARGHYFHQDLWAAKEIYCEKPECHVDIGSRIDGFISHLLVFRNVTVVDVRSLESPVDGLIFKRGDITCLEFDDNSLESISCLHALEHIGLGRYGDELNYNGWQEGLKELERTLKPGGILYLGVPIGRERVCFNAHRVFDPSTICDALGKLILESFSYVDDFGNYHERVPDFESLPVLEYGCGLFKFKKECNYSAKN